MCKRVYLKAEDVEKELQEARETQGFVGKMEQDYISRLIKDAKRNSMIGDKLQVVIDPMYVHMPAWQRRVKIAKAISIGVDYNRYKWDAPKILYLPDLKILICIDGQHRIYGAFKAKMDSVVVEIMECTLAEAIDLFMNQSKDRDKMQPMDMYNAAIAGGKQEYVTLRDICHKHNVAVKGETVSNEVGTLTSISDGIELVKRNSDLLDGILRLLGNLGWNGYADSYNGKAYTAKIIRALKALYAYTDGRTDEMETALIEHCKGTEYFVENIMDKTQAQIFDYLSGIVRYEMESPFTKKKRSAKVKAICLNKTR